MSRIHTDQSALEALPRIAIFYETTGNRVFAQNIRRAYRYYLTNDPLVSKTSVEEHKTKRDKKKKYLINILELIRTSPTGLSALTEQQLLDFVILTAEGYAVKIDDIEKLKVDPAINRDSIRAIRKAFSGNSWVV